MLTRLFGARLSQAEVLAIIARFVSNTPAHPREWEDFLRAPIANKRLETVRQRCLSLPAGDEGTRVLREIIRELRTELPPANG